MGASGPDALRMGALRALTKRRFVAGLVAALVISGAAPAGGGTPVWRPRVQATIDYIHTRSGSVSFAAVNENGRLWGYRRHGRVEAVSVFKAMLLVTYLRMGSVDDRELRRSDRRLLGPMIKRSDNYSASRVRDIVGHARIRRLARAAGMKNFTVVRPWGASQITARDQARFFEEMERWIPERHERYARYLLSHIVPSQRWGLAHFADHRLPGWDLFFKGGWGSGTGRWTHQVAFLEKGGRRIAVAILTEYSPSHSYGARTLRGVARRLMANLVP